MVVGSRLPPFLPPRDRELRPGRACLGRRPRPRAAGAVLLEVVLALALFLFAAVVIGSGLKASVETVDRLRLNTHAFNLATTAISELRLGLTAMQPTGPEPFAAPFDDWTREIVTAPFQEGYGHQSQLILVEVIVRHTQRPIVRRLCQVMAERPPLESPGLDSRLTGSRQALPDRAGFDYPSEPE